MPEDSPNQPDASRRFPNAGLLADSPFADGTNPFAEAAADATAAGADAAETPAEQQDGSPSDSPNAYAANYAERGEFHEEVLIRLGHRGGTLMLVAIFTLFMLGMSMLVGIASMLVVLFFGAWVLYSGLSDLSAMSAGRMNPDGRAQTR